MKSLDLSRHDAFLVDEFAPLKAQVTTKKTIMIATVLQPITGIKTEKFYALGGLSSWKSVCSLGLSAR
jgi:hypothetical protein